ncbi:BppU family phage baseplate upper protein [Halorubrum ezzemoulense]|uniref:BppU family phage baseplate upper protein n=1 Tax=Halorubrum ezzemoulense TaxID=337243 RepID=UPI00232FE3D2|nr:BppU family phage baseplate upper protein [Halorubrum ezzemoulense]MDB2225612.1 BppU family phage baseplate upper protein [Halorubrum ezzemoulense]
MAETFSLAAGDTAPSIQAVLRDSAGNGVDLTDADVRFQMCQPRGGDELIDEPADVIDAEAGVARYNWNASDTNELGRYRAEFVVTYNSGAVETFPNVGAHDIVITR